MNVMMSSFSTEIQKSVSDILYTIDRRGSPIWRHSRTRFTHEDADSPRIVLRRANYRRRPVADATAGGENLWCSLRWKPASARLSSRLLLSDSTIIVAHRSIGCIQLLSHSNSSRALIVSGVWFSQRHLSGEQFAQHSSEFHALSLPSALVKHFDESMYCQFQQSCSMEALQTPRWKV